MIRIRSGFYRTDTRIQIVPCRQTHGRRLEALIKLHAFPDQRIQMGCFGLLAIYFQIPIGRIVRDDQHEIGFFRKWQIP